MAAQEATLSEQTSVAVLAALQVNGSPKVMFDLRAGVIAGVVAGVVLGLIDLLIRRNRH
jgi:thiamine transporter ThiT